MTLRDLVRQALRMRPDRLVVGECRGAEVVDLLAALNTGHEGGAGTLHANAPADVPARLEALGLLGGVPRAALHAQVAAGAAGGDPGAPAGRRVVDEVCMLLPRRARAAGAGGAGLDRGRDGPGAEAPARLFANAGSVTDWPPA